MMETNGPTHAISKIARVMDEIAFQTSLLRLNAAVQAASGGGASSGWNAQAARDTTSLLEQSIAETPAVEPRVLRALRERALTLEEGIRSQAVVPVIPRVRTLEGISLDDQR